MMEWDAVAKHLNWYSLTIVYTSVLWTSASELITPLKSAERGCF